MVNSASHQIPLIDFAPFLSGDAAAKQQVADRVYQACHHIGFMTLINHGIPQSVIDNLFHASKQFFALPLAQKLQCRRSERTNCGYIPVAGERLNPKRPWDWKEAFNVGKESIWPTETDTFQAIITSFYDYCTTETAIQILRAFALGLALPEFFFDQKHDELFFLRLLHYPPFPTDGELGQLRAGEHTDYGSLTLLFQDDVGGLEVCTRQGDWLPVPYQPGSIVVNVGDAMQRWTNDRLRSTLHRVVNPSDGRLHCDRYSIALFCDPNPDVDLACLPSCMDANHPAKYTSMTAGDYLTSRLNATY